MEPVHRILGQPAHLRRLQARLSRESPASRRAGVRRVCREFRLIDARDRWRERSCQAALEDLEHTRQVQLPPPRRAMAFGYVVLAYLLTPPY